jgi:hypothetical protein
MTREKTGGRKPGVPNKVTSEMRSVLKSVFSAEIERLPEYIQDMDTKQKVDLLFRVFPYILPKVKEVHHTEGEGYTW